MAVINITSRVFFEDTEPVLQTFRKRSIVNVSVFIVNVDIIGVFEVRRSAAQVFFVFLIPYFEVQRLHPGAKEIDVILLEDFLYRLFYFFIRFFS